ncbi:MAG: penicillin-binding protein 1C [Desulfomonilaceae bacterium]|nr:penicillin-binding protein 1C [Desulfomonilaceae bacterium]
MKRSGKFVLSRRMIVCAGAVLSVLVAVGFIDRQLPDYRDAIQEQRMRGGRSVVDREGRLLRLLPDDKARFNVWRDVDDFPDILKKAVIAAEDKRFWYHPGFDPFALTRAVWTNIVNGRTISGASTITQQVVRLIRPRPRTYGAKFIELLSSMKMERQLTKDEILELHLNLSPMGGAIRGAALASRIYFGKDVTRISVPEAAVLAALPRSPSRYSPRRGDGRMQLSAEKDRILTRMAHLGYVSSTRSNAAAGDTVRFENNDFPLEAPHLVDFVMTNAAGDATEVRTTVDLEIQHSVEQILTSHKDRLLRAGISQAAAVIVSVPQREVLAMVGSLRYGRQDFGYNNAVLARRSAGSTLKPFLYALALDTGSHAFSEIPDTFRRYPTPHGDYMPVNADRRSYGPVSIRSALGNSLNISAVKTASSLGVDNLFRLLQRLELADDKSSSAEHYGLGMAVGNIEVSLFKLVQAYASLADGGLFRHVNVVNGEEKSPRDGVFSPEAAYIVTHILADPTARLLTFGNPDYFKYGFPVALKTGTSTNYKDTWVVGYTPIHVVGIWAGNFDGRPNNGVSGSRACGPILKDIVHYLYGTKSPGAFQRPDGVVTVSVCSMSGMRAGPACTHTTEEPAIRGNEPPVCDLRHDSEYHYLGGPYAQWLHQRETRDGRGRYRLGESSRPFRAESASPGPHGTDPVQRLSRTGAGIEIVSPHDADRFVLSPHHTNRVLLRAVPHPLVRHVVWFVNGMEVTRTPPPYEYFWIPTKGRHVIHAVTPEKEAARITVFVE